MSRIPQHLVADRVKSQEFPIINQAEDRIRGRRILGLFVIFCGPESDRQQEHKSIEVFSRPDLGDHNC